MLTACKREETVIPSKKDTLFFQLPQGNAPYDKEIVQWQQQYGCYVLYRFTDRDYRYGFTGFYPLAIMTRPADTTVMPAGVRFLQKYWFDFYPTSFLRQYLPFKILLAGRLQASSNGLDTTKTVIHSPVAGMDFIMFPGIDTGFADISVSRRQQLKVALQQVFLRTLFLPVNNNTAPKLTMPPAFFEVSNYFAPGLSEENKYTHGFLQLVNPESAQPQAPDPENDFMHFLNLTLMLDSATLEHTYFSPEVDEQGLIRRKYSIIRKYFSKELGVDITAVARMKE